MAWFEVRLVAGGRARSIEVEAADERRARDAISGRGRVLSVRRRLKVGGWGRPLDRNERHILFIRLAAMLDSRVGLAEALRRIAAAFRGRIRRTAERMADAVELGDDLADAMLRQPRSFPPVLVALVRAGGFGEGTPAALRTAAEFERQIAGARQGFRSGSPQRRTGWSWRRACRRWPSSTATSTCMPSWWSWWPALSCSA